MAKYENGRDNEIRKLAELLKSVIWRLSDPYRMKRGVMPYYPPKGMTLLAVMMFMSLSEWEYVSWLKMKMEETIEPVKIGEVYRKMEELSEIVNMLRSEISIIDE